MCNEKVKSRFIFKQDAGKVEKICIYRGLTTEAEGPREPVQHGVLPGLAGGDGWSGDNMYCDGRVVLPAVARGCSAASFWQSQLLLLLEYQNNVHKTHQRKQTWDGFQCTVQIKAPWV